MALGIRLHLDRNSLSTTVRELEKYGIERSRKPSTIEFRKPIVALLKVLNQPRSRSTRQ